MKRTALLTVVSMGWVGESRPESTSATHRPEAQRSRRFFRVLLTDDDVICSDEAYRVVGRTLIVNKPGCLVNAKYRIDGKKMTVDAPKFRAVLAGL